MKPETIARRAKERKAEQAAQTEDLLARLKAKAEAEGPDSIWAEMYDETYERAYG
jgi:hypothetical protein